MTLPSRFTKVTGWKPVKLLALAVFGLVASLITLWWHWSPPKAAKNTCLHFVGLLITNRCTEAYRLTARTTYEFSTVESFCTNDHFQFDETWRKGTIVCDSGEWRGANYVVFGRMHHSPGSRPLLFGMELTRRTDKWLVQSLAFDE